ncbi:MAG: 50S ribosomal protein L13 [Myxococcota bacterium]
MRNNHKSTLLTKEAGDSQREWWVIDLEGQILGRAATHIASVLRGKHKPTYTPHVDSGDFVVVVNAGKLRLTGNKFRDKKYRRHTQYPGGLREITADKLVVKAPDRMVRAAVWGMLPKGRLGRKIIKKLKIYNGPEHHHKAQAPQPLQLGQRTES